jgi:hypothetical protein
MVSSLLLLCGFALIFSCRGTVSAADTPEFLVQDGEMRMVCEKDVFFEVGNTTLSVLGLSDKLESIVADGGAIDTAVSSSAVAVTSDLTTLFTNAITVTEASLADQIFQAVSAAKAAAADDAATKANDALASAESTTIASSDSVATYAIAQASIIASDLSTAFSQAMSSLKDEFVLSLSGLSVLCVWMNLFC